MGDSFISFVNGDVTPLVQLIENFLESRPVHSVETVSGSILQTIVELIWAEDDRCTPELCLITDPERHHGDGQLGFVDLFITGSVGQSVPVIKFKNVTLLGFWKGMKGSMEPTLQNLESLCNDLRGEEEVGLMRRNYCYWEESSQSWRTSTVQKLKDAGLEQLKKCLRVVRQGIVRSGSAGILDRCIRCVEEDSHLDRYVVMCIGGMRVFGWKAETVQMKWIYRGA
jgi:hypothetical protein